MIMAAMPHRSRKLPACELGKIGGRTKRARRQLAATLRRSPAMKRLFYAILLTVVGFAAGSWLQGQPQPPAVLPRELTSYREVVKRVLPAVVSIETRAKPGTKWADRPQLPDEFRRPPGSSSDPGRLGFGSGFLVDAAGVVVTNYHVVEGAEIAIVHLHDGRKFSSKNIRSDRRTD